MASALYNLGIYIYVAVVKLAAAFKPKARLWRDGRKDIFDRIASAIPAGERIFWIHAASLGEFEQGRPIIEAVKLQHPEYKILLTFFSPSGYEVRKNYDGADYIFYLPADTHGNARRFIEAAHPEIAVFVKYEFWLNYLKELKRSNIRTFIVSSIFRRDSVFFKWYGGIFRRCLGTFEHLFVQNAESKELLKGIGVENVTVSGDTRFDRVTAIAAAAIELEVIDKFADENRVFVAGSTWPHDEELISQLIASHTDMKFIIAPHEMDQARIDHFIEQSSHKTVRYTNCVESGKIDDAQVLVVDTIGLLSSIYRYASYAYIGGGFGVGIHNILEAATFGLPIVFGPNFSKFREAREMVAIDAARSISTYDELNEWLSALESDKQKYDEVRKKASEYVAQNTGATQIFLSGVFEQ